MYSGPWRRKHGGLVVQAADVDLCTSVGERRGRARLWIHRPGLRLRETKAALHGSEVGGI